MLFLLLLPHICLGLIIFASVVILGAGLV